MPTTEPRSTYDFASDNASAVDPRIFAALARSNAGTASPYGADDVSKAIDGLYSELFEKRAFVFPVATGTAANGMALGAIAPSYGAIFAHARSHIVTTECGAPEFYTGGARLDLISSENGRIQADAFAGAVEPYKARNVHHLRASALSIAQSTDQGTIYSLQEIAALCSIAHDNGLKVHMDGARFANAMVALGCTPAQMSWKAGIDILSLGTTKNGTMNVEAVVVFDDETASILRYLHKRAGFLWSKMRFSAVQLAAYIADGVWIDNATKANANAQRLAAAIEACPGTWLHHPVEANQVFVHLDGEATAALSDAGIRLRRWGTEQGDPYRLVASYCDTEELVARFEKALSGMA